jgi:hypothetical protein
MVFYLFSGVAANQTGVQQATKQLSTDLFSEWILDVKLGMENYSTLFVLIF